jgi:hypothetical protein
MTEENARNDMNKALFAELVMMLSSSAMQQLGKLVHPATGKAEVNLEAAQVTIDLLVMLKEKTKGNLDSDEEAMLGGMLSSLQMNFVETSKNAPAKPAAKPEGAPSDDGQHPSATPEPSGTEKPPDPGKEPKYRKTYG